MATVPVYGPRRVQPAALPGVRVQARETPESLGAPVAEAQERLGGTLVQGGLQTLAVAARHAQEAKTRAKNVRLLAADTQLGNLELELRTQMAKTKGRDALALRPEFEDRYAATAREIEATLPTDDELVAFRQRAENRRLALMGATENHSLQEYEKWEGAQVEGAIANATTLGVESWNDPAGRSMALADLEAIVRMKAQREGFAPDDPAVEAALDRARSLLHEGVITRMISNDHAPAARAYFDRVKAAGQLTAAAVTNLEGKVTTAGVTQAGFEGANQIIAANMPADDLAPIPVDAWDAAARALYPDSPEKRQATINELHARAASMNAGREQRRNYHLSTAWRGVSEAVYTGGSRTAVLTSPSFLALPGPEQDRIRDAFRAEDDRILARQHAAEQAAYQAESRAATRESRIATAAARGEREREQAGLAAAYRMTENPDQFVQMTEGQIAALYPVLGRPAVEELTQRWRQLRADKAALEVATFDQTMFKTVATAVGIPYATTAADRLTVEEAANLQALRTAVYQEISRQQGTLKRQLRADEKTKVMRDILESQIMLPDAGPLFFDAGVPIAILTPDQRKTAAEAGYVRYDAIPVGDQQAYDTYFKENHPTLWGKSSYVVELRARASRAYALRLLRRSEPEIRAVLDGKAK